MKTKPYCHRKIDHTDVDGKKPVFMFGRPFKTDYHIVEEPYGLLTGLPNCNHVFFRMDFDPTKPKGKEQKLFFYYRFPSVPVFVLERDNEKDFPELLKSRPVKTPQHIFVDWPDYLADAFLSSAIEVFCQPAEKVPFMDSSATAYAYKICRVLRWPKEQPKAARCMRIIVTSAMEKYYRELLHANDLSKNLPVGIEDQEASQIAANILATGKLDLSLFEKPVLRMDEERV